VPVITGFCTNEGTAFIPASAETGADFRAFFADLLPAFTAGDLDAIEALYPDPTAGDDREFAQPAPPAGCGAQWRRLDRAYADYAYICPVLQTAHFLSHAGQPVHVYEYAAHAGRYDAANHGDEAAVVAHDLAQIGRWPGLVAVADAMHSFWARFVVDPSGNPNSGGGSSSTSRSSSTAPNSVEWPDFVSPFDADGTTIRKTGVAADGSSPVPLLGQLVVFGEGNDERVPRRSGPANLGTPARVRTLTDLEVRRCKFWWDRVELSQGLGRKGAAGRGAPSKL
jgi:hypothetical protein